MQWQHLQKEYIALKNQLEQVAKYKKQQHLVAGQIAHIEQEIVAYEFKLKALRKTLEKNEQFSFLTFVRSLTGKKQRIMEESLSEAMTTELKLVETQLMLEDLQDDQVDRLYKLNAINESYSREQLRAIEAQKQQWLEEHESPVAIKLNELTEEYSSLKRLYKEMDEAYMAADQALAPLENAIDSLKSAQSYSTWDTFFGGGFIVTAIKHDKIEQSQGKLHDVQMALQRLQNEVIDIETWNQTSYKINIDGLVKFADYFFDDIFSAWSVHSKLATSVEQLKRVSDDVYNTKLYLNKRMNEIEARLKEIKIEEQRLYLLDETML